MSVLFVSEDESFTEVEEEDDDKGFLFGFIYEEVLEVLVTTYK
jgi:hypothetical protein